MIEELWARASPKALRCVLASSCIVFCLVLVQPRKTHPDMTEKLSTGTLRIKTKKIVPLGSVESWYIVFAITGKKHSGEHSDRCSKCKKKADIFWTKLFSQGTKVAYHAITHFFAPETAGFLYTDSLNSAWYETTV